MVLVERLQVSRPVLREGLARLQSMGVVEVRRGSGTYVGNSDSISHCIRHLSQTLVISPKDLLIYTELRTAIEIQAVRQAALLATDADLKELDAIVRRMSRDVQKYEELLELDFRFHRKLIEIAGNPLMKSLIEIIYDFILVQMTKTTPLPDQNQRGKRLHAAIVRSVRSRDPDRAERAMRDHMDAVVELLQRETTKRTNKRSTRPVATKGR